MVGRRRDPAPSAAGGRGLLPDRLRTSPITVRAAVVVALFGAVWVALRLVDQPSTAVSMYALVPILLAVFWFGLPMGLLAAAVSTALFLVDNLLTPASGLAGGTLVLATVNRALVFFCVAALVSALLQRERTLTLRVRAQQEEIAELESLRAVLTPAALPEIPHLRLATSFTPAEGLAAGDFYLVVPAPGGSTTVIVGDVVGHGLEAARCAAFVRAALSTFARFSTDPVELLQLANAALVERSEDSARFVTAVCLNIGAPPELEVRWAAAGHDVPWYLDTGTPLPGGRVGAPLGVGADALTLECGTTVLEPGAGFLAFTDGLPEGRPARRLPDRPLELFGEDRARAVVRSYRGAAPAEVLEALAAAVAGFAGGPLADDVCLVAVRTA